MLAARAAQACYLRSASTRRIVKSTEIGWRTCGLIGSSVSTAPLAVSEQPQLFVANPMFVQPVTEFLREFVQDGFHVRLPRTLGKHGAKHPRQFPAVQ